MTNITTRLWAIIPAAGVGTRFSTTQLKQYQYIDDKTILQHSVDALYQLPLSGCVIAISENDHIAKNIPFTQEIQFCLGGKERMDSVLAGLYALQEQANANDYIIVHDAARPCLHTQQIQQIENFCRAGQYPAAIIATPVRDTLKKAKKENVIDSTLSREHLWQAQTPQIARYDVLLSALESAKQAQAVVTDEASALERLGYEVQLIQGRLDNLKITYPEDLALAQLILQAKYAKSIVDDII